MSGKINQKNSASASPKVTAIVSTYKSERFIRGCLEDLQAQTIAHELEIIVVDSASPEQEKRIVEEFQQRYSNIVYLRSEQRETLYSSWNRAIKIARGQYLTNANTDDRHAPKALERLSAMLDQNLKVDVVYGSMAITEEENSSLEKAPRKGCFKARAFDQRRLFRDCLPGPQPLWRRALHDRFGMFDESFASAGDYEFWLRISGEAGFLHTPEVLGLFLDSAQSLSHHPETAHVETERARTRHWPEEWGPRKSVRRSVLDQLTRRTTYRRLAERFFERWRDTRKPA